MTWDLTSYFPQFNGPEMQQFKKSVRDDIEALQSRTAGLEPLSSETISCWEEVLICNEDLTRRMSHLGSYVSCLASTDAASEEYRREEAALARTRAELAKVRIELLRALKHAPDDVYFAFVSSTSLTGAQHYLSRVREEARRSMSREKEILATDLAIDGIQAWGRLYNTISSKVEFDMEFPDGRRQRVPMAQRRSLMEHPDRRIRKAAFEKGNDAWAAIADTAAAGLNAIAGTRLSLNRHRAVDDFLDVALFHAAISRKTLDAMFEAVFTNLETPRRILALKSKQMGEPGVAWYDLGAPLKVPDETRLPWSEAHGLVKSAFSQAYPALGDFFGSIVARNWIDWEPRPGKRPGAFCSSSMLINESRIFMTYNESLGDILTLAHESGHAYHGHVVRGVRPYGRMYPMTLAETASTFGELVLINGVVDNSAATDSQKAMMLDIEIGHGAVYLLDIPVRYEFEKALYEERRDGELSVTRLKDLMVETQHRVLGPTLVAGGEDPYFWASKLHFYITGLTFYNFPYTFGFLLSRGLYAMFRREGPRFLTKYEELLRLAGSDTAERVVKHALGIDLETPEFWCEAIRSLEEPLNRLESLLPKITT